MGTQRQLTPEETARGVTQTIAEAHVARFKKTEFLGDRGYVNLVVKAILAEVDIAVYIGGIQESLIDDSAIEEIVYRAMWEAGFYPSLIYAALLGLTN